ncbi:LOW QUALITY PROTEIN: hypothetical protein AQUCO_01200189v1 [Aquilegia coerulea]|uniref:Replication protein A OB domain-containing protein n=1 Tax=Aquilegia coerulea TaxID=218851 RepID=A0A2G5E4W3_AQUCA|nr:LOW QUALITY PROTEIN: hypothetical protein AQUCO_01200189v1 [Aquilegia coerulea]
MACSSLHRLSEIDDTTDLWKVKDHQVHATIPKRLITKYSAVIREGGVYFLQNLMCLLLKAKGVYRPVQHRYKDTNVKPVSDIRLTFPKFKFDFVEYNNIKFIHGDNTYLTDVYGKLESVSNVMNVERGTLREIFLKDRSGTTLKVTLWGQANQQLPDDVVTASAGCPILVVTSSTVKLFDGNYSLSSTTATKIYVNLDIPEVADLKETNSNEETTVKLIAPSSTAITLEERMVSNRKTLVEIVQAVPNAAIGAKFTCKGVIGCHF